MAAVTAILLASMGTPAQASSVLALPAQGLASAAPGAPVARYGLPDSERGAVLTPARSAASQVTAWNALPNQGLDGSVRALAVVGSDLYVGGSFDETGDGSLTGLGSMARYDAVGGTWHPLPNQGLDGSVYALVGDGDDLYVGGSFDQTGDGSLTGLKYIARYDTAAGTWHALPNGGFDNTVLAMALSGDNLFVGGYLTETADEALTDLGCVARYDTVGGVWHALPNQGLDGGSPPVPGLPDTPRVYAMAAANGDLFVGGDFHYTGDGSVTDLRHIARYDIGDGTWNALPPQGLGANVYALAVSDHDLYLGGVFYDAGGLADGDLIARWNIVAETWHALPNQGLNDEVEALAVSDGILYVGGEFTMTRDGAFQQLGYVARYDTAAGTWQALPNQGLDDEVRALAAAGSDVYVGGFFHQTGDGSLDNLGHIARGVSGGGWTWHVYLPLVVRQ